MAKKGMCCAVAMVLVLIGALTWSVAGLFGVNLVGFVLGDMPGLTRILYILVGLSALYVIYGMMKGK